MKVVWSSQARGDLRAIRDFISRDSEHYASMQIERLIFRIEQTAEIQSKGHPIHEFMESEQRMTRRRLL